MSEKKAMNFFNVSNVIWHVFLAHLGFIMPIGVHTMRKALRMVRPQ